MFPVVILQGIQKDQDVIGYKIKTRAKEEVLSLKLRVSDPDTDNIIFLGGGL